MGTMKSNIVGVCTVFLLLVVAMPASGAGTVEAEGLRLELLRPPSDFYTNGQNEFLADVTATRPGLGVSRVEFYVNDTLVASVRQPPYRCFWNPGETLTKRVLRVVAVSTEGKRVSVTRVLKGVKVTHRERVDLVLVYTTAEKGGNYVMDLEKDDFQVKEDGEPMVISQFSRDVKPLKLAVLIDTSKTMDGNKLVQAQESAIEFIKALKPEDQAMVIGFADDVEIHQTFTADQSRLKDAILRTKIGRGTAFYDAVYFAVNTMRREEGKRAVVVITDGKDESYDGLSPGSFYSFEDTHKFALTSDIALYCVGIGKGFEKTKDFHGRYKLREILDRFAEDSGGRAFYPRSVSGLGEVFKTITDELKHQYTLAYYPPARSTDGKWHSISVKTRKGGYKLKAKKGYFDRDQ